MPTLNAKKNPSHRVPSQGVVNVVTLSHPGLLHLLSVGDPDPQDPHVFGPPGSRSISQSYGSGSGSFPFSVSGSATKCHGSSTLHIWIHLSCWIRVHILNSNPDSEGKKTHKYRKKERIIIFCSALCSFLRAVACAFFMRPLHLLVMCHTYFEDSILSSQL